MTNFGTTYVFVYQAKINVYHRIIVSIPFYQFSKQYEIIFFDRMEKRDYAYCYVFFRQHIKRFMYTHIMLLEKFVHCSIIGEIYSVESGPKFWLKNSLAEVVVVITTDEARCVIFYIICINLVPQIFDIV